MENRKPSGRSAGKYGKPQSGGIKRERTDSKSYSRSGNTGRRDDAEHARPSGRLVVKKVKPEDRPYIRTDNSGAKKDSKPRKRGARGSKVAEQVTAEIRLNRFIANSGVCSRRDADEHIKNGLITVNGKLVTDLGTKVTYDDDVRLKNKRLSAEKKVYILMNKPKDYVTTVEDPHAEHTVLELIGDACPQRVYPVGRLDKATTGVLLLTNDGELTGKLTHPKYKRKKIYHVHLDHDVTKNDLFKLTEGIELDGANVVADAVAYADTEDKSQIGIELHSGQNRVIRRMFETIGYKVKKLDRVYFAGLTKKNLKRGKWRFLTDKEVSMLKRGIF
jgi:23S rRNA pseudouridine2605 synthase